MEYVLQTNNLCKSYKNFNALNGLTMNVPKGSIYGFVGRNGAGKTTLIRQICGLQAPTSGDYILYGIQNTDKDIVKSRRRMGAVVETPSIHLDLTAADNLKQQYEVLGMPSYDGIDELLALVGLGDTGDKKAKNFSLGMRQRLSIAVSLAGNPDFIVLYEPINGLDPQGIIEIRELILKLNHERQITVLISSHILDELAKLATHYGFVSGGKMIKEMSAEELENVCRKSMRVEVSNTEFLAKVLDNMNAEYKILSDSTADIYASLNVTSLVLALHEQGCDVNSITENNESLESYFISLVGGKKIIRLLHADFLRFRKMSMAWVVFFGMIAMIAIMIISAYINDTGLGADSFQYIMYFSIIMVAPIGMFIGHDYTNKTIRNKIIVGHSRVSIYMSNWLICIGYVFVIHTFCEALFFGVGIPLLGSDGVSAKAIAVNLVVSYLIVAVYASFSIFTSMTVKSNTGIVLAFLLNYALMLLSVMLMEFSGSDTVQKIIDVLPTSQMSMLTPYEMTENPVVAIIVAIAIIGAVTLGGVKIFKDNDIS